MQIAFQHATDSVPRPSAKNPGVPEQLDELVLWATEKDPDDRPTDAQIMLDRLREIERELGIAPQVARTLSAGIIREEVAGDSGDLTQVLPSTMTAPTTTVDDADNATRLRTATKRRSRKGAWLVALVLLLAGLAAGAGWWFGSGPGSQIAVPDVAGRSFAEAQQILAEQSLQAVQADVYDIDAPGGVVVGTDPAAGSRLEKDATVSVLVSLGPQPQTVQALAGTTAGDARGILQSINLTVAEPDQEFFTDAEAGSVIAVSIAPRAGGDQFDCTGGCTALEGDTAILSVSVGPVPNVFGETVESATQILAEKNLSVAGTFEEYRDDLEAGLVVYVAQREGGGDWRPGESVTLAVSRGPEPVEVPDVVGDSVSDAVAELEGVGFQVGGLDGVLPIFWDIYRVNGTSPAAGELAVPGSTVTITGISF
jgi:serine/threonine-protein kinase